MWAYNIAQRYWNAHLRAKTFDSRDMPSPDDWCALCDTYCSSDPPYETYLKYFSTNLEFVYPTSFARHVCEGLRNDLSWSTIFSTCVCVKNWCIGKIQIPLAWRSVVWNCPLGKPKFPVARRAVNNRASCVAIQLESSISNVSIVLHNWWSGSATVGGGKLLCNNVDSADALLIAAHYNSAIHSKEIS